MTNIKILRNVFNELLTLGDSVICTGVGPLVVVAGFDAENDQVLIANTTSGQTWYVKADRIGGYFE